MSSHIRIHIGLLYATYSNKLRKINTIKLVEVNDNT